MNIYNQLFNLIKKDLDQVKNDIQRISENESEYSEGISDRLSYVLNAPGKQLRPAITLICSNLFNNQDKENSIRMATAVELLHIATLIHDDTVDSADVRRGKATASSLWGGNIAVLLGDYVFATSAVFVCDTGNINLVKRFAETIVELSKGELIENIDSFNFELSKEKYFNKTYLKTASLFKTASYSGAVAGNADEEAVKQISDFGYHFGMAYQIQDDVLDFISTQSNEGKPVMHDLSEGIITLPLISFIKKYENDYDIKKLLKPKSGLTSELKSELQDKIINSESIEDSTNEANYHYEKAEKSLNNVPNSNFKDALIEIINYAKNRA
jgi:geranylgeranyl pyrophosphate synthase